MKTSKQATHVVILLLSVVFLASIISIKTEWASKVMYRIILKRLIAKVVRTISTKRLDAKYTLTKLLNANMFNAKSNKHDNKPDNKPDNKHTRELTIELADAGNLWAIHTLVPK